MSNEIILFIFQIGVPNLLNISWWCLTILLLYPTCFDTVLRSHISWETRLSLFRKCFLSLMVHDLFLSSSTPRSSSRHRASNVELSLSSRPLYFCLLSSGVPRKNPSSDVASARIESMSVPIAIRAGDNEEQVMFWNQTELNVRYIYLCKLNLMSLPKRIVRINWLQKTIVLMSFIKLKIAKLGNKWRLSDCKWRQYWWNSELQNLGMTGLLKEKINAPKVKI